MHKTYFWLAAVCSVTRSKRFLWHCPVKGAVSWDFRPLFFSLIEHIWAPDKQAKMGFLKNSFSRRYSNFSQISPRKRICKKIHFSLFIRGPDGFDSWNKKMPKHFVTLPLYRILWKIASLWRRNRKNANLLRSIVQVDKATSHKIYPPYTFHVTKHIPYYLSLPTVKVWP